VVKPTWSPSGYDAPDRAGGGDRALLAAQGLELRVARTSAGVLKAIRCSLSALQNLVINAIRYTERGGIVVGCRRVGADRCGSVVDSGIGIPGEEQGALRRLLPDPRASAQGLGLGLPIVRARALLGHVVTTLGARPRQRVLDRARPHGCTRGTRRECLRGPRRSAPGWSWWTTRRDPQQCWKLGPPPHRRRNAHRR
jgi:hypothetical protein